ncbi:F0F1 ATP synthase subunit B [Clostridium sp.]|jgi:F-type H+-transporting ATPase subunit b|uniref:F0F1 ATP synthase subunit B n=1 Tax=Clostridium sp. TaxID=1506 RepID=UPI003A5C1740
MQIVLGKVIITIINFIILYFILKHFFFDTVNNRITSREEEIAFKIKSADENQQKSKEILAKHNKLLTSSKQEGKNIVEEYKNKASKVSDDIIKDAQKEAQLILSRAKTEADREREKAKDDIKSQVVNLAMLVSSKALEGSIDEEQHRRLIQDFISKVGI